MKQALLAILAVFCFTYAAQSQDSYLAKKVDYQSEKLNEIFFAYEVYELDYSKLQKALLENPNQYYFKLEMGAFSGKFNVHSNPIRKSNYVHRVATDEGITIVETSPIQNFKGFTREGLPTHLTVTQEILGGSVYYDDYQIFAESMRYLDEQGPKHYIVVYKNTNVRPTPHLRCGFDEIVQRSNQINNQINEQIKENGEKMMATCWEFELAIASDGLMTQRYGSTGAVESRNLDVLDDVRPLWNAGQFEEDIEFLVVTQFTSTSPGNDPWTSSTNASTLLGSFRSWGEGGGFGVGYDIACLWTDRNLNGGTIGIAYLNGTCNSAKYHVCEDYGGGTTQIRNLWAHEMGHNFSCNHTSGFWIMAPSVNTSSSWANQSVNEVNNYVDIYEGTSCPTACGNADPPIANFVADPDRGCIPFTVEFTDLSIGLIDTWNWTFPGGNPSSSTDQDPIVEYAAVGEYDVSLEVIGPGGSDFLEIIEYIIALDEPVADFDFTTDELKVEFEDKSTYAETYFWDFGDGNTSFASDPIHFYDEDGIYTVLLEVENECGISIIEKDVEVISKVTADFTSDLQSGCAELTVQYEDLSSSNVVDWEWEFEGGIPAFSTDTNPEVLYTADGIYGTTLTVFSRKGRYQSIKTDTAYIEVLPLPTPLFTYQVDSMDSRTVHFTNQSMNATSYFWEFGDGNTSTEENPSHTYATDDFYLVTLTAENACGDEFYDEEIEISSRPTAGFTSDPDFGCEGGTVQFIDTSSNNTLSVLWEFEGGNPATSTNPNPVVSYSTPGIYDVYLYATNANGTDSLIEVDYIEILNLPTSTFDENRLFDGLYEFTNTSNYSNDQIWDFGDGDSSTVQNPSHQYELDGDYEVILTSYNACDTVRSTRTVEVVRKPVAGFISATNNGCADLQVRFEDQSSGQVDDYFWEFEGGTPTNSTDANPSILYDQRGVFDVTLIVSNVSGNDTVVMTDAITVLDIPESGFTYTQDSLDFDFSDESNYADSVAWDFGDGSASSMQNPQYSYDEAGNYLVMQIAFNVCGNDTSMQFVTVDGAEPLAIISSSNTRICVGDTVYYFDQSAGNPDSWEWTFEGGEPMTSNDQDPFVVYNNPGVYDASLEVDNGFGTSSTTLVDYVEVVAEPVLDFACSSIALELVMVNQITGVFDSLEWDFGDGNTSTENNPVHTYQDEGTYTITLTVFSVCGESTLTKEVQIMTSSIVEIEVNSIKIYPNPTTEWITAESEAFYNLSDIQIEISNVLGQFFEPQDQVLKNRQLNINVNHLAAGTYYIKFLNNNQLIGNGKFVILR